MILQPKDFEKKLLENVIITNQDISEIFCSVIDDKDFIKQIEEGFTTYIMLNINEETLAIANVKKPDEDTEEECILDSDDIVAVNAFQYLKQVVSY